MASSDYWVKLFYPSALTVIVYHVKEQTSSVSVVRDTDF